MHEKQSSPRFSPSPEGAGRHRVQSCAPVSLRTAARHEKYSCSSGVVPAALAPFLFFSSGRREAAEALSHPVLGVPLAFVALLLGGVDALGRADGADAGVARGGRRRNARGAHIAHGNAWGNPATVAGSAGLRDVAIGDPWRSGGLAVLKADRLHVVSGPARQACAPQ